MEVSRNLRSANKLPARSLVVDSTRPVLTIHRRPAMESVGTLAENNVEILSAHRVLFKDPQKSVKI